jgi:hypothetical protein
MWGVWFSCGLFAASLCWMLQAWTSKQWALATSILAIATLGVFTYWAQSYWGGMLAACGGALLFGGMRHTVRSPRIIPSILTALGVLILANTRMYEGLLVCIPAAMSLGWWLIRCRRIPLRAKCTRWLMPVGAVLLIGGAFMSTYYHAVTGSWLQTPYGLHTSEYFYQDIFLFSPIHEPERKPVARLAKFYGDVERTREHGSRLIWQAARNLYQRLPVTIESALGVVDYPEGGRNAYRAVLLWILAFVMTSLRRRWAWFCVITVFGVVLGGSVVRWWFPHYTAPLVPLVLATMAMTLYGIGRPSAMNWPRRIAPPAVVVLAALYVALPVVYILTRDRSAEAATTKPSRTSSASSRTSYRSRSGIQRRLEQQSGSHLVFVSYDDDFSVQDGEWVYNPADLNAARVIFAHELGAHKNSELIAAHPGCAVWIVRVSAEQVQLAPYSVQ